MGNVLLLFTQSSKELYKRDVLNACCQANDTILLFSYKKEWVDSSAKADGLVGAQAVLIYCEFNPSGPPKYTYHPIRCAVVLAADTSGDYISLQLELKQFFDYEQIKSRKQSVLDAFQLYAARDGACPEKRVYVRQDTSWERFAWSDEWGPLAAHFAEVQGLQGCTFFCVQPTHSFGNSPLPLFPKPVKDYPVERYVLRGGRSMRLALWIVAAPKKEPCVPELTLSGDIGYVTGPTLHQRADGMQATYFLQLRRSTQMTSGMVRVHSRHTDNKVISPQFSAVVQLRADRLVLLAVGLLAVGSALGAIDSTLIKGAAESVGACGVANHSILVSFSVKFVGVLLVAIGAYLGFGRFPAATATLKT